jgi:ubiquinone/menaquinone biosynthesis C-methylase UbiE
MSGVFENSMASSTAFDRIAPDYDSVFSTSAIGRAQRSAVWVEMDRAFQPGQRVLEINCGTGIDAIHLALRGIQVDAYDGAPGMIALAQRRATVLTDSRSARFQCLRTEELAKMTPDTAYDGVLSNFSGLNCVSDLQTVAQSLSRFVRPRGKAVLCLFGTFCLWEILWYLASGSTTKAFRRWRRGPLEVTLGSGTTLGIRYWQVRELKDIFRPYFRLERRCGVGIAVPPSYAESLASEFPRMFRAALKFDAAAGRCPIIRSAADHVVLTFERREEGS